MAQSSELPTTDSELKTRVRSHTGYEDNTDELPDSELDDLISTAKARTAIAAEVDASKLYNERGYQFALLGYACIFAKSTIENIHIEDYDIGDTSISVSSDDPDDSQQFQDWASWVSEGLGDSDTGRGGQTMRNTSGYIGEKTKHSHRHGHNHL